MTTNLQTEAPATPSTPAAGRQAVRSALRAELLKGADVEAAPVEAAPPPRAEAVEPDAVDVAPDDAGDEDAAPPAKVDAPDADTSKRLAAVQAEEKRARAKVAAERAEVAAERAKLDKERAEVEAAREELAAYRKARERAKVDPVSALEALGVDDWDHAAKQAYARGKDDPKNKDAAARSLREREAAEKLAAIEKRIDDMSAAEKQRAESALIQREAAAYMADVTKAAGAGTVSPLAKHFLAKAPEKTGQRLAQIAVDLLNETGDRPDVEDVLARYEKVRREELLELGVDPASLSKTDPKKPDPQADKKPSAKTLANDLSTPRVPRPKSSERELRAETRAALLSGRLDE